MCHCSYRKAAGDNGVLGGDKGASEWQSGKKLNLRK